MPDDGPAYCVGGTEDASLKDLPQVLHIIAYGAAGVPHWGQKRAAVLMVKSS